MPLSFNFTNTPKDGYVLVPYDAKRGAPLFDPSLGYGFVRRTGTMPSRDVHTDEIVGSSPR